MRVTIAAIGKDKRSSPTCTLFNEYQKRLPWDLQLKELEEKKQLPVEQLKEKEASLLLNSIDPSSVIIALDENGSNISSEEFANKLSCWQESGRNKFAFLVGGAAGHGKQVLQRADLKLSFGKLTWPHMLARAMLAEQLYRAYTIITGHPYHKK